MTGCAARCTKPSASSVRRVWASIFSLIPSARRRSSLPPLRPVDERDEHEDAPLARDVVEDDPAGTGGREPSGRDRHPSPVHGDRSADLLGYLHVRTLLQSAY